MATPEELKRRQLAARAAAAQQAQAAEPAPKPGRSFLGGVNEEIAGLLDMPSLLATVPMKAAGLNVTTQPFTDLFTMTGIMSDPAATEPTLASRLGQGVGGGVTGGLGAEAVIARAATQAATKGAHAVSNIAKSLGAASPGRRAAAEAAGAAGYGAGATVGAELGGPVGEVVGGVAGSLTPGGVTGVTRRAFTGGDADAIAANVADFERAGVPYTAGQVSSPSGIAGRYAETSVASLPGGNIAAEEARQAAQDAFGERLMDLTPRAGDATATGARVKRDINEYSDRFSRESEERYGAVYDLVEQRMAELGREGGRPRVVLDDTLGALSELTEGSEAGDAGDILKLFAHPKLGTIRETFQAAVEKADGELSWDGVRRVRSAIGRVIGSPSLHTDEPIAELKQVYGALSRDMRRALVHLGDDVVESFDDTNLWFKEGVSHIEDNLDALVRTNIPERIVGAFNRSARQGSTVARWYKDALPRNTWREVRDGVLQEMGKATASNQSADVSRFSSDTFLTNWGRMDDGAKDVLMPRGSQLRRDMDSLARVADQLRESARTLYNPSGTANRQVNAMLLGTALTGSLATGRATPVLALAGTALGSYGTMKLLTTPGFARTLVKSTRWPVGQWLPNMNRELDRLRERAEANDDLDTLAELSQFQESINSGPGPEEDLPPMPAGTNPALRAVPLS